ncbi:N-acetylated-alpha-linked acidic dipeptidase 2 [Holothuria leucospilota]|uniref:Aminopeptidase NAALADL1 n=1 Tax=Holothuria leucospilota TaxID=206669 RepID=A0A9Q0YSG5_HOLLE|nr:N-acetylated-alpha-linked acidic dipeptidase 2 [Holothuria leucospilota]
MDRRKCGRLKQLSLIIIAAIIGFLFGIIIMALASRRWRGETLEISDRIQNLISADNIRNNLRETTKKPHVAGTEEDWKTANNLKELWLRQGFDSAKLIPYDVLLQYPPLEKGKENRVQIVNSDGGDPIFESTLRPDTFGEEDIEQDGILPPYHAYSGSGDVMGEPVYVNYGSVEDLEYLRTNLTPGINFTGKVFICRKWDFRVAAKNAQRVNAAALIVFPDPQDHSVSRRYGLPYPDGPYLPKSATVWGSLYMDIGDPLTPNYPSTDGAFRIPMSEAKFLSIPVHPIGYGDAQKILSYMTGPAPPADTWRGDLNVSYQVGPGFKDNMKQRKIRVVVNSEYQQRTTYNVIGFIRGSVEPDRYVIIGNHRDAWGLGAVDPTGGTAVLMEISRVFGKLKKEGWRPRRTIMFASWGAEEFTLTGSVEWTEQFHDVLTKRTLAYLNLDIAVTGKYVVFPQSTPFVAKVVAEALKKVQEPYPSDTRKTLYDTIKERLGENPEDGVHFVDGGTDYEAFYYGLGIASVNAYYLLDFKRVEGHPNFYSLYHTQYETFRLVDKYIDEGFLCHRAIGQLYAEILRNLGDSLLISTDMTKYINTVNSLSHDFRDNYLQKVLENAYRNISFDYLSDAIDEFSSAVENFQQTILPAVDTNDPLAVRAINDQMMYLEQAFLSRERLPGKAVYRHALVAPSAVVEDNVQFRTFPGLMIALHGIDDDPNQEERWEEVERQLAIVTHVIRLAASALKDFTSW